MGEMMIDTLKENIPVVIIRPSMIQSTYKEPFAGWIQGNGYRKSTFVVCIYILFQRNFLILIVGLYTLFCKLLSCVLLYILDSCHVQITNELRVNIDT